MKVLFFIGLAFLTVSISVGVLFKRLRKGKTFRVRKYHWKWLRFLGKISHYLGQHRIRKSEVILQYPSGSISKELDGLAFVQISDIHYRSGSGERNNYVARQAVDIINKISPAPSFLFATGDLTDHFSIEIAENLAKDVISKINIKEKYAVFGSHDVAPPLNVTKSAVKAIYERIGMRCLDNESATTQSFPHSVRVIGAGSLLRKDCKPPKISTAVNTEGYFNVCLSHNPDSLKIVQDSIDDDLHVVLSGHTHNGQVCVPIWNKPFLVVLHSFCNAIGLKIRALDRIHKVVKNWEHNQGLFELGDGKMKKKKSFLYVNAGLGSHCDIRLFNRPEITVFRVKVVDK